MTARLRHWIEWYPWRVILCLACGLGIAHLAAPAVIHLFPRALLAVAVSVAGTATLLLCALLAIVTVSRMRTTPRAEALLMGAFLLAFIVLRPAVIWIALAIAGAKVQLPPVVIWMELSPVLQVLSNFALILLAAFAGRLVGRMVREANLLLIVTVVAAAIDFWGVYWGPVGAWTQGGASAALASHLSVSVPGAQAAAKVAGQHTLGFILLLSVGPGDFLFLAMFFAVLYRLRMNQLVTFWLTFLVMLVAPGFFVLGDLKILPIPSNLPGLPFIAAGMLIANWRHFRFSREERRALITGACIIAVLVLAIILLTRLL